MALLLWYLILLSSTLASPVLAPPDVIGTTCTNVCLENYLAARDTTCPAIDAAPVFNTRYRSTIGIVWSCLAIIFASTWICVHPNVAGYKTTKWQKLWRRVKLFALAVFAPELLAVFAFFQWKGCWELHKAFRDKAKELNIPLDLDAEDRALQSPEVLAAKSARVSQDTLSEPLVPSSRTPPPETTTLTCVMHYPKRGLGALARAMSFYEVDLQETAWTLTHTHFVQMGGIVFKNPEKREVGFKRPWIWKKKTYDWETLERSWTDEDIKNFFALRLSEEAITDKSKASALAKTLVVMQVLWFVVQTIARAPVGQWIYSPETKLYPNLYCYHADRDECSFLNKYFSGEHDGALGGKFTLALSSTSATFGALHAIGWSLPSPSHAGHLLWRASCLVLMCYPLVPLVCMPFFSLLDNHAPNWVTAVYGFGMVFISFCGAIAYIGARFILLVLPFLELRNLPPLAHQTVSWSNFLPHI